MIILFEDSKANSDPSAAGSPSSSSNANYGTFGPPPSFEESTRAGHIIIDVGPDPINQPPAFELYHAEYNVGANGEISSRDQRLNEDGMFLGRTPSSCTHRSMMQENLSTNS
jgi:hypothetical protein